MNLKVSLVAMPWSSFDLPSLALASLSAFVRSNDQRFDIQCYHEYLHVWNQVGDQYKVMSCHQFLGELFYLSHLYRIEKKESTEGILKFINDQKAKWKKNGLDFRALELHRDQIEKIFDVTREHIEAAATKIAIDSQVVGLTTSYSQLFSSLCLARRIREKNKDTVIVLGGANSEACSHDLVKEYNFIDCVIEGEGEPPFLALLRSIHGDEVGDDELVGVIAKDGAKFSRVVNKTVKEKASAGRHVLADHGCERDIDKFPFPDYSEYETEADRYNVLWVVPVETARGCWWNRKVQTGNPRDACYFCGLTRNSKWRSKSIKRISSEMKYLSQKHTNCKFRFVDNVLQKNIGSHLVRELRKSNATYWFFAELRASTSEVELLDLAEAGCNTIQIGIEGLSTKYLSRMNKGTTVIQNLASMKSCMEFGISCASNLLIGFPGATQEEVDETRDTILDFAIAYNPLMFSTFSLDSGSTVSQLPEEFGIINIRNVDIISEFMPADISENLLLPWLDFDIEGDSANWEPVFEAYKRWKDLHAEIKGNPVLYDVTHPLFYLDGDNFLEIIDRRDGFRTISLEPSFREVYLFCSRPRTISSIVDNFSGKLSEETIVSEILQPLKEEKLVFEENNEFLSLAVAWCKDAAARRIRRFGKS